MKILSYISLLPLIIASSFQESETNIKDKVQILNVCNDTTVRIKRYKDLNSIREFREIQETGITLYREYYMDTGILKEEGSWDKNGDVGIYKYYSRDGVLEKEINFKTNTKTLYGKESEPYDDVFNFILRQSDSILKANVGEDFFNKYLIFNSERSHFYGSGTSGDWFDVPDYRPNEFLMRYEIKIDDTTKFDIFEFHLDSLGKLVNEEDLQIPPNFKPQALLTLQQVKEIGLQNEFTEDEVNSSFLRYEKRDFMKEYGRLVYKISGEPYNKVVDGNKTTMNYQYIMIDAWTGELIKKDEGDIIIHQHEYSGSQIIRD